MSASFRYHCLLQQSPSRLASNVHRCSVPHSQHGSILSHQLEGTFTLLVQFSWIILIHSWKSIYWLFQNIYYSILFSNQLTINVWNIFRINVFVFIRNFVYSNKNVSSNFLFSNSVLNVTNIFYVYFIVNLF